MIKNFFAGLGDVKRGIGYTLQNRSLLKVLIIPFLINFVLFGLVVYFLIHNYSLLFDSISSQLGGLKIEAEQWWTHIVAGLLWLVRGVLHVVLGLVLIFIVVLVMLLISQVINSPFYDLLSESVEKREQGIYDIPFSLKKFLSESIRIVLIELKKLGFFISVPLFLLILNFIPLLGSLIYTILGNLFAAWDMGFNYLSYPMSRKVVPFRKQLGFGAHHKARLIGFGLPLLIPFFNILFAPFFVVGGTLIYLELKGPGLEKSLVQNT